MGILSKEQQEKIIKTLNEHGAKLPCPRCGNLDFTLLDGYFNQTVGSEPGTIVFGGISVPSVVIACRRCGYLSQHSIRVLGLLQEEEVKK
jgi:predicted nucleic-acid-binding Zn-ribbon protein